MPKKSASKRPVTHDGRVTQTAEVASVGDFKKKAKGSIVRLPSGIVVKLRKPDGLKALVSGGKIPNSLMGMMQDALDPGRQGDVDVSKLTEDPQALADLFILIDRMAIDAFLEPKLNPAPEDEADRSDDLLYVDEVDINDRMWILGWAMAGVSDVAPFRQSADAGMEALADVAGVQVSPIESAGSD